MKKLSLFVIVASLAVALVGCSGGDAADANVNKDVVTPKAGESLPPNLAGAESGPGGGGGAPAGGTPGGPAQAETTP